MGDVLRYNKASKYHLILNVRAKTIKEDDGIFYYYSDKVMKWKDSTDDGKRRDDTIHFKSPFIPGEIYVGLNGNDVIHLKEDRSQRFCDNSFAWIPQHGIYRLNAATHEWTYMYYYPDYLSGYLT
ncbi:unnamed protein product [Strongylus vulgaris]|uniref:Uncharacterized protein n=1 Tax=Strongylus vulgaris TaxID=40348 RepID=A0A3P7JKL6_STRVU|nr:unnamed protein product [Strongylus vulgaris]